MRNGFFALYRTVIDNDNNKNRRKRDEKERIQWKKDNRKEKNTTKFDEIKQTKIVSLNLQCTCISYFIQINRFFWSSCYYKIQNP